METEKTNQLRMLKRFLSVVLCCALLLSCVPVTVSAAMSGTCGENLTWTLSDNGVLTFPETEQSDSYTYLSMEVLKTRASCRVGFYRLEK